MFIYGVWYSFTYGHLVFPGLFVEKTILYPLNYFCVFVKNHIYVCVCVCLHAHVCIHIDSFLIVFAYQNPICPSKSSLDASHSRKPPQIVLLVMFCIHGQVKRKKKKQSYINSDYLQLWDLRWFIFWLIYFVSIIWIFYPQHLYFIEKKQFGFMFIAYSLPYTLPYT